MIYIFSSHVHHVTPEKKNLGPPSAVERCQATPTGCRGMCRSPVCSGLMPVARPVLEQGAGRWGWGKVSLHRKIMKNPSKLVFLMFYE